MGNSLSAVGGYGTRWAGLHLRIVNPRRADTVEVGWRWRWRNGPTIHASYVDGMAHDPVARHDPVAGCRRHDPVVGAKVQRRPSRLQNCDIAQVQRRGLDQ